MALPAGRYGVTKNQLLKIKKLPMNTIKLIEELTEKFDLLGSAAFKNSTSTVTESSDLVESGAVKDIIGWGNKNLVVEVSRNTNIDSSGVITSGSYDMWYGKVTQGVKYTITSNDNTGFVGGFFTQKPATGSVSYDGQRIVTSDKTFTAPITGYVAFRSYTNYTTGQLEKGDTATEYEPYHTSVDESKANNTVITNNIETGTTASKAYSVNDLFILNGTLGKCTQPISSGGTFTLNTNYIETTIGELISSLL